MSVFRLPNIVRHDTPRTSELAELEDDEIHAAALVPKERVGPRKISTFLWTGRLYAIVSRILRGLYEPIDNTGTQLEEAEESKLMLSIENDLAKFRNSVPAHLNVEQGIKYGIEHLPEWCLRHRVIIRNR